MQNINIDLTEIIQAIIALLAAIVVYRIIPAIKAHTSESQQRMLQAAIKTAVCAAEQFYGAGHGAEKLQWVRDELESKGYTVDTSAIEAQVGELNWLSGQNLAEASADEGDDPEEEDAPEA